MDQQRVADYTEAERGAEKASVAAARAAKTETRQLAGLGQPGLSEQASARRRAADATAASALARLLHHRDHAFMHTGSPLGLLDARCNLCLLTDAVHLDDVLCLALTCRALRDALWARFPPRPAAARPHPGKRLLTHIRAMLATPSRRSWGRDYLDRIHPNPLSLHEHTNEPTRTQWAEAAAQAVRCAGLQVAGFPVSWNWPNCAVRVLGAAGVYVVDEATPAANGFPHYSNRMGWHLYHAALDYCTTNPEAFVDENGAADEWHLRENFPGDDDSDDAWRNASPAAIIHGCGALHGGNRVWMSCEADASDMTLTVTELSTEEVAAAAAAGATRVAAERATARAQSTRCAGLRVTGLPVEDAVCGDGVYVVSATTPNYDGFPCYVNLQTRSPDAKGFCLVHSKRGLWHLVREEDAFVELRHSVTLADNDALDEDFIMCVAAAHTIAPRGEVPVGLHTWMRGDKDENLPGPSQRPLMVTELSAEEVTAAATAHAAVVAVRVAAERAVAAEQRTRCAGLRVVGLSAGEGAAADDDEVYVVDARTPEYAGFPLYVNSKSTSYLFHSDGEWLVMQHCTNNWKVRFGGGSRFGGTSVLAGWKVLKRLNYGSKYTFPDLVGESDPTDAATAAIAGHGEVPVGEHVWACWNAGMLECVNRPLTVSELTSEAEAAEAERAVAVAAELWRRWAVGLGPEASDAEIAAAGERRDGMVYELFERYDADKSGFLDSASYREYLVGIKFWGTGVCTDAKYEAEGWAEQCKGLDSDPAVGISLASFRALYANYRAAQLDEDYANARVDGDVDDAVGSDVDV
jgi:hypothetical protein